MLDCLSKLTDFTFYEAMTKIQTLYTMMLSYHHISKEQIYFKFWRVTEREINICVMIFSMKLYRYSEVIEFLWMKKISLEFFYSSSRAKAQIENRFHNSGFFFDFAAFSL